MSNNGWKLKWYILHNEILGSHQNLAADEFLLTCKNIHKIVLPEYTNMQMVWSHVW